MPGKPGPPGPPHSPAHQLPPPLPRRLARGHRGGPTGQGGPQTPLGAGGSSSAPAPAPGGCAGSCAGSCAPAPSGARGDPGGAWPGQVRGGRTARPGYVKRYAMSPPGQPRGAHNAPGTSLRSPGSHTEQPDPIRGSRETDVSQPFKHFERVRAEHPKVPQEQSPRETNPKRGAPTSCPPRAPHSPNPSQVRRGERRPLLHSLGAGPRPGFCHGPCSL